MKTMVCSLVVAMVAISGLAADTPSPGFRAEVLTPNIRIGERVKIAFYLDGPAFNSLWVPSRMVVGGNVSVEVFGPAGTKLPYLGKKYKLKPLTRDQFVRLTPEYYYGRWYMLTDDFKLTPVGKYRVVVNFSNQDDGRQFGYDAWTGVVSSNELEFLVIE